MQRDKLVGALSSAGQAPVELWREEASLVAIPQGARVLGLFAGRSPNLLWAHPSLESPQSAADFFAASGWRNTGGARTWISPERDLHVRDLDNPWASYQFQASIDPGRYDCQARSGEIRFATRTQVTLHRLKRDCEISLCKSIRLIPHPLRDDPGAAHLLTQARYAGYEQVTRLGYGTDEPAFRPALSLWDAVNLPAPGQVIIPTLRETRVRDFFEPTGPSHVGYSPHGIRFLFDARERHKIAVRATDLPGGRAGYYRRLDSDTASLVVRNFALDPSAEYIDTPWDDPGDRGYVLQCYNDSGLNGLYGELEYHSPAMGGDSQRNECLDRAQLWGFQGPVEAIEEIVGRLLGAVHARELAEKPLP